MLRKSNRDFAREFEEMSKERREIVNGIKDGIRDELLRVCM